MLSVRGPGKSFSLWLTPEHDFECGKLSWTDFACNGWHHFKNHFLFDNPWFWFWLNKSPGKLISSKSHKWKKMIDSVMSLLFWGNQKLKWFWNQVTRNNSHLNWLPGGRKLRKDWRNREAWTHTQLVAQFLSWILMFVPWVKIIIAMTVAILLPDDEFVPEEVNSCTKVWLGRCNRLWIWGKYWSEQNESLICQLHRRHQISLASRSNEL